jgi:hypothetical protein
MAAKHDHQHRADCSAQERNVTKLTKDITTMEDYCGPTHQTQSVDLDQPLLSNPYCGQSGRAQSDFGITKHSTSPSASAQLSTPSTLIIQEHPTPKESSVKANCQPTSPRRSSSTNWYRSAVSSFRKFRSKSYPSIGGNHPVDHTSSQPAAKQDHPPS